MKPEDIPNQRLANQQISTSSHKKPDGLVSFMGAIQAQSYNDALWAIGLRLRNATQKDIEASVSKRLIIRTWPMRHTLHFVSPNDVRWMLALYRDQEIPTYQKRNGLTEAMLEQGKGIIKMAFDGKSKLTSKEIYKALGDSGNTIMKKHDVQAHILRRAGRDGIICFASRDGKQPTFALLEEWAQKSERIDRNRSLAELACRYFTSHGPATIKDYVWWSGIRIPEAKAGIEASLTKLVKEEIGGKTYYMAKRTPGSGHDASAVHLLPAFDEYVISYSDRSAILCNSGTQKWLKSGKIAFSHSNGIFLPTIISDGQVVGTWKRELKSDRAIIKIKPFTKLSSAENEGVSAAAERYGRFISMKISVEKV